MNKRSKKWLSVWNKKGKNLKSKKIQDLLNANGHDSFMGSINKKYWLKYIKHKIKSIKLKKNQNILEYGCGSGAFLSYFYNKGFNLFGIDYSKSQIKKSREYFPKIKFKIGEISEIDTFGVKFDFIFSNVVFHYMDLFPTCQKKIYQINQEIKFI